MTYFDLPESKNSHLRLLKDRFSALYVAKPSKTGSSLDVVPTPGRPAFKLEYPRQVRNFKVRTPREPRSFLLLRDTIPCYVMTLPLDIPAAIIT